MRLRTSYLKNLRRIGKEGESSTRPGRSEQKKGGEVGGQMTESLFTSVLAKKQNEGIGRPVTER